MAASRAYTEQEFFEDTQENKYLTFSIGAEAFAIELKQVLEIIGVQNITSVPEVPDYVRGILNLRGKIIPVIDVRLRFHKPFLEYTDRTCIIVVKINEVTVGLIVDRVDEVVTIPETDIVNPPEISGNDNRFLKGIGKVGDDVTLILDCEHLVSYQEKELLIDLGEEK